MLKYKSYYEKRDIVEPGEIGGNSPNQTTSFLGLFENIKEMLVGDNNTRPQEAANPDNGLENVN